jgi:pilus assembly protein Flp/PilA
MMYLSALRAQTRNFASKFVKNKQGVTAIEYAIVAAGVAAVVLVIFGTDANSPVNSMLTQVFATLKSKLVSTIG